MRRNFLRCSFKICKLFLHAQQECSDTTTISISVTTQCMPRCYICAKANSPKILRTGIFDNIFFSAGNAIKIQKEKKTKAIPFVLTIRNGQAHQQYIQLRLVNYRAGSGKDQCNARATLTAGYLQNSIHSLPTLLFCVWTYVPHSSTSIS